MQEPWGYTFIGGVPAKARWLVEVTRGRPDGQGWFPSEGAYYVPNIVTQGGADYLASRIGSRAIGTNSTMAATAIGTVSTAATLSDATITGEVDRKLFDSTSLNANTWVIVNTWGGGADAVTSVVIVEAGIANDIGSGQGILFNRVVFASVTLADSDFLKLQLETQVHSY